MVTCIISVCHGNVIRHNRSLSSLRHLGTRLWNLVQCSAKIKTQILCVIIVINLAILSAIGLNFCVLSLLERLNNSLWRRYRVQKTEWDTGWRNWPCWYRHNKVAAVNTISCQHEQAQFINCCVYELKFLSLFNWFWSRLQLYFWLYCPWIGFGVSEIG